jgi:hypothetical protein
MSMKPVLHSFAYSLEFLREQVADVVAEDMVKQPSGVVNHPAWVIGHLTIVCQALGGAIGIPEWLPDDWPKRFASGTVPVSDSSLYETKNNALAKLQDAQSRIMKAVSELDDSHLDKPFPDESYRDVFPSIRHFLTQVLVGHTAYHIGQLGVWRKAMGLPRMQRSFE